MAQSILARLRVDRVMPERTTGSDVAGLPWKVKLYVGIVALSGATIVALAAHRLVLEAGRYTINGALNSPHSWLDIAIFMCLAPLASMAVILVPEEGGENSRQSLSSAVVLAAVVVFPWFGAILIVSFGILAVELGQRAVYGRRPLYKVVFNASEMALSVAAAAGVFGAWLGRTQLLTPRLPGGGPGIVALVLATVAANYVVNYGLMMGALSLATGTSVRDLFVRKHQPTVLPEMTAAVMGILFGYLWLTDPPLSPIALMPLAVIYLAFKNFIRLQELDRLKSNFVSEVSHELRTPLSAILASSELLYHHGDTLSAANIRELSRSGYESSNHLFRLVENLLNATTLQSGTLQIRPVSVSLDELVSEAVTQVQPFVESKRQRISLDIPMDLPEVLADPRHIGQVLINLLTNASKYSPEDTTIEVACRLEGAWIRISVTDEGVGIPLDEQRSVFERFYRAQSDRESSVVGSGLGLTIVRSLVDLHHGKVGVNSYPGRGSNFWFTLPRATGSAETA